MRLTVAAILAGAMAGGVLYVSGLRAQEATRSVWDGVYTPDQAERGKKKFDKDCAPCHGEILQGNDTSPTLTGGSFLYEWYGFTVYQMYDRIHRDMPANENKGSVTRAEAAELTAYILSFNGFPPGKTPLSTQDEVLKDIRIEEKK